MRAAPFISESAQWQTTSWTDHLSGRGRHRTASSGTTASASRMRSGPRSYCTMRSSRSAALKNFDGAANAYRAGLKKRKSTDLAIKLHSVLLTAGRKVEAEKFASGWLTEFPKDADFRFHLGDLALSQGDYAQAESNYLGVIQLRPDNAAALNNLAWLTSKLKKKNALAYAEKANSIAPGQPIFMDTLAMILAEESQFDKAITLQKKAIEIQTNNPALRLTLAKIYVLAGDKGRARDELLQLSKIGPQFAGHEEVSQLLKSL